MCGVVELRAARWSVQLAEIVGTGELGRYVSISPKFTGKQHFSPNPHTVLTLFVSYANGNPRRLLVSYANR